MDGLNGRATVFGGAADGRAFYGAVGSVTMPLGNRYGLQIDGVRTNFDSRFEGNVAGDGVAAHLFWRDPSVGLLGAYGHYLHSGASLNSEAFTVNLFAGAAEGALYLGRFTIEGVAGVQGGQTDLEAQGKFDIATRFFDAVYLSYYPTDNLRLSLGQSYALGQNGASVGAELGLPVGGGGGTMPAIFATGRVSESGDSAVMGGLHIYFGQRNKTLIRRHREDDPTFVALPPEISNAFTGAGSAAFREEQNIWAANSGNLF